MKVVFTGQSGHIGGCAFELATADPRIDTIINLVRRAPATPNDSSKVKTIVVKDFNNYDEDTLREVEDADAAIWCMGTFTGDPLVHVDYPTSFWKAVTASDKFRARTTPFRFLYLGGAFTVPDQDKTLWFMPTARKGSGLGQTTVLQFAQQEGLEGKWESYVVKPGGVFPVYQKANLLVKAAGYLAGSGLAAWNDEVGTAMIDVALRGNDEPLISSRRIAEMARAGCVSK